MPDPAQEKAVGQPDDRFSDVFSWISLEHRDSAENVSKRSPSIPNSVTSVTGTETVISEPTGTDQTDYQEDRYMFKNVGKRFREHLKRFGELFSKNNPELSESERSIVELERIPAEDFEDITRFIWSAFRVPFNVLNPSTDHNKPVPVILSLIKVPAHII